MLTAPSASMHSRVRTLFGYPPRGQSLRPTAWLDGLRGLAAFEVFIFHYCDGWFDRTLNWGDGYHGRRYWYYLPFIRTIYGSGDMCVSMFFIISGFVLTYSMLKTMRTGDMERLLTQLSSAVIRRAIRLYVPVMIITFCLMILTRAGMPKPIVYEDQPTWAAEFATWVRTFNWLSLPLWGACLFMNSTIRYDGGISWTIPMEYEGSLNVWLALLFLCRFKSIKLRTAISIVWIFHRYTRDDWISAQFIGGMMFADWHVERSMSPISHHQSDQWPLRRYLAVPIFIFGVFIAGLPNCYILADQTQGHVESRMFFDWLVHIMWHFGYYDPGPERIIACIAAWCLFFGFSELQPLQRLCETRFVQYLGKISFGLYLCHIFLRAWLSPWRYFCLRLFGIDPTTNVLESASGPRFFAYVLFMIPATSICFIVGGTFYRTIDTWSINLGKWLEEKCLAYGRQDVPVVESKPMIPLQDRLA